MKFIIINLLFFSFSCFASQEQKCPAKLDGYIQQYEIYREQFFADEASKCVPDIESFIMLKGIPDSSIKITGFVVGLEVLYHEKLDNIIKITSKTGAHTTVVKLLAKKHEQRLFTKSFNWDFSSSMAFITLSKNGKENLQVVTRNNEHDGECAWEIEDTYQFIKGKFETISSSEVEKICYLKRQ